MPEESLVIHNLFSRVSNRSPDRISMQIKEAAGWQAYTYKEVELLARRIGAFLIKRGFKKGERAALILENRPEWGIVYLGLMFAGLACVALDHELSPKEINTIFNDCQPRVVFTCGDIFKKLANIGFRRIIWVQVDSEEFTKIKTSPAADVNWPEVHPADIASLIYTSGTTGKPKGVVLTHANFSSNFSSIEKLKLIRTDDNFLAILPLFHTYAFMVTLLVPLLLGAKITYVKGLRPEDLTAIIKEAKITILVGVPQLFALIYRAINEKLKKIPPILRTGLLPLIRRKLRVKFGKSLRLLASGGARLEPEISKGLWQLGFKIIEGYGLTETSPVATFNPLEKPKFGSVGKSIPDVEVKILNPDPAGVGEVLIKGPNVMQGYFKRPDLTAEVITRDGWFNSQDLGYLDQDGYLFLSGRKKDVIVLSSGKNIYPQELEEYYAQSRYIKEICVLEKSQERFGQKSGVLFGVVLPEFDYLRKKKVVNTREKIHWELENLSSNLPAYMRIRGFIITREELPRTRLKKIKRYEVYQRFLGDLGLEELEKPVPNEEEKIILESTVGRKIIQYLSAQLKKKVELNSHLELDLGIDSLTRVELGLGLERVLVLKIPEEFVDNVQTVKELILNIQRIEQGSKEKPAAPPETEQKGWAEILSQEPARGVLQRIRLSQGLAEKTLTLVIKGLLIVFSRLFWLLKVSKRENIPAQAPYIICSNHASYLDPFFLFAAVPLRCASNLFFIGHADIFEHPLVKWAIRLARLIPIDPVARSTEALQASRFVLSHKKSVCVFPEGMRSVDDGLQEFKKGIGILVKESNVPVIPVYIKGSHYTWPRTKKFPRLHPVKIIFGRPVLAQRLGGDYKSIAEELRQGVLKLKNSEIKDL